MSKSKKTTKPVTTKAKVLGKKKKKSNAGRPTKMSDLTVKKLEEAFALGCTDLEACLMADISKQTLYTYQDNHPEFIDRKERLKESPVLLARKSVIDKMPDNGELAMKFLERKKKDEFSLKKEIDHGGEIKYNLIDKFIKK